MLCTTLSIGDLLLLAETLRVNLLLINLLENRSPREPLEAEQLRIER